MVARLVAALGLAFLAFGLPVQAQDAEALRSRHAALRGDLSDNAFGRPLHVESSESGSEHKGAIHAIIDEPFKRLSSALRRAEQWCEVLVLQANVKHCEAANGGDTLAVFVARKPSDPLDEAYRAEFKYGVPAVSADYLRVALHAPEGPLGTTDYRIRLEATPLDASRTFLHLAYSYSLRGVGRIGMNMYLATSGRDKVGFSVVDRTPEGKPVYVAGVRGMVERTTMRYYLALEAYLGTLDAPAPARVEKRLRAFHAGLERYRRQLHELELAEYLEIKRRDVSRVVQARQ